MSFEFAALANADTLLTSLDHNVESRRGILHALENIVERVCRDDARLHAQAGCPCFYCDIYRDLTDAKQPQNVLIRLLSCLTNTWNSTYQPYQIHRRLATSWAHHYKRIGAHEKWDAVCAKYTLLSVDPCELELKLDEKTDQRSGHLDSLWQALRLEDADEDDNGCPQLDHLIDLTTSNDPSCDAWGSSASHAELGCTCTDCVVLRDMTMTVCDTDPGCPLFDFLSSIPRAWQACCTTHYAAYSLDEWSPRSMTLLVETWLENYIVSGAVGKVQRILSTFVMPRQSLEILSDVANEADVDVVYECLLHNPIAPHSPTSWCHGLLHELFSNIHLTRLIASFLVPCRTAPAPLYPLSGSLA